MRRLQQRIVLEALYRQSAFNLGQLHAFTFRKGVGHPSLTIFFPSLFMIRATELWNIRPFLNMGFSLFLQQEIPFPENWSNDHLTALHFFFFFCNSSCFPEMFDYLSRRPSWENGSVNLQHRLVYLQLNSWDGVNRRWGFKWGES